MEEKHSRLGLASFGISVGAGVLMFILFVVAGILNAGGRIQHGQRYPGQMIVGFVTIGLVAVDFLAVALGIAALFQPGTKRLFGILGLVFSSLTIIGTGALIVIGLLFASRLAQ